MVNETGLIYQLFPITPNAISQFMCRFWQLARLMCCSFERLRKKTSNDFKIKQRPWLWNRWDKGGDYSSYVSSRGNGLKPSGLLIQAVAATRETSAAAIVRVSITLSVHMDSFCHWLTRRPVFFFPHLSCRQVQSTDTRVDALGWDGWMDPGRVGGGRRVHSLVRWQPAGENQFLLAFSICAWPDRSNTMLIATSESMCVVWLFHNWKKVEEAGCINRPRLHYIFKVIGVLTRLNTHVGGVLSVNLMDDEVFFLSNICTIVNNNI